MPQQKTHYTTDNNKHNFEIVLCCNGISSPANMGSLFRLADAFGIQKIYFDSYDMDISSARLRRTARATEKHIPFESEVDLYSKIEALREDDFQILGVEITEKSVALNKANFSKTKVALVLGNEALGISESLLELCDTHLHIDMFGLNSSMNVAQAAGIALYEITKQLNENS